VILVRFEEDNNTKSVFQSKPEITVYPNPAKDDFWIRSEKDFSENGLGSVEVFNLTGDMIYNAILQGSQHQVDLHDQPAGLYLVRMGDQTYKVLKN
jgi:hypothetical protein